jgi:hypothetical protein
MQQPEEIANFVEVTTRREESTKLRIPLKIYSFLIQRNTNEIFETKSIHV